jgi:hypothetical protein
VFSPDPRQDRWLDNRPSAWKAARSGSAHSRQFRSGSVDPAIHAGSRSPVPTMTEARGRRFHADSVSRALARTGREGPNASSDGPNSRPRRRPLHLHAEAVHLLLYAPVISRSPGTVQQRFRPEPSLTKPASAPESRVPPLSRSGRRAQPAPFRRCPAPLYLVQGVCGSDSFETLNGGEGCRASATAWSRSSRS